MIAMPKDELRGQRRESEKRSAIDWASGLTEFLLLISFLISLIAVLLPWIAGKIEFSQLVDSWQGLILAFWCGASLIFLALPRILNKCGL